MRPGSVFAVAGFFGGGGGGLILFGLGFGVFGLFFFFPRLEITCPCIKMQYPDVKLSISRAMQSGFVN